MSNITALEMRKLTESFSKKDIETIFSNNSNKFTPYDNTLPSLKLLSKVFGRKITEIEMYEKPSTLRLAGEFDGFRQRFFFNKYELAHKCKLHFYSDEEIPSYVFYHGSYEIEVVKVEAFKEPKVVYRETWMDTPYDINQVFKACEWIVENKDES